MGVLSLKAVAELIGEPPSRAYQRLRRGKQPFDDQAMELLKEKLAEFGVYLDPQPPSGGVPSAHDVDVFHESVCRFIHSALDMLREQVARTSEPSQDAMSHVYLGASRLASVVTEYMDHYLGKASDELSNTE